VDARSPKEDARDVRLEAVLCLGWMPSAETKLFIKSCNFWSWLAINRRLGSHQTSDTLSKSYMTAPDPNIPQLRKNSFLREYELEREGELGIICAGDELF